MPDNYRKTVFVAAILAAIVGFAAINSGQARAESTLQTVLKRGELIAGVPYDAPPSSYVDPQGNVVGYAPDVARYMAKRLGVKVKFAEVTSASRVPLLRTGRIDAEFGITTPQKVRNEVVDFTYSYIWDNGVLMVRQADSAKVEDYQNADKIIGATQGNGFIDNWKLVSPNAKFKVYRDESDVVIAVKKGEVDAYLANSFNAARFAKSGGLAISPPWKASPDSIMMRQDDSKWRNWLNWALQRMWLEGTIQKLYVKWYGIEPDFRMGDNGEIQQRVHIIGQTDDPWQPLPAGFMEQLLGDKSYALQ